MATKSFTVDLYSLAHGGFAETLTIDAALDRLVPTYYIDREKARKCLRDGQPLRTTGYEYRRSDDDDNAENA